MTWTEQNEAAANKLLNRLKQDPDYDLKLEYGTMLMRHVDSFTPTERQRYDELTEILTRKKP